MKVFLYYRTYWGEDSRTGWSGRNVLAKSKMEMVKTCISSMEFDRLDSSISLHKIACVDNSTPDYTQYLERHFDEVVHTSEGLDISDTINGWIPLWGMKGGFVEVLKLIESRKHLQDDIVLIIEDDDLFRENGLMDWIIACSHFQGFVTPYDHPYNYYRNDMFCKIKGIDIFNNIHWRESTCNTGVVGGKHQFFKKTRILRKIPRLVFGPIYPDRFLGKELASLDVNFCRRLRKFTGIKLYSPMPGLAQHLSKWPSFPRKHMKTGYETPSNEFSPGVNWEIRYKNVTGI